MRLFSPTVTFRVSALMVAVFVFFGAVFTEPTRAVFAFIQDFIVLKFGWFYTMAVGFFLVFIIWLFISPHGKVRLGKEDDEPEYSTLTWFAMLFSAGMGIGLLFYGVAEPIMHFSSPHLHPDAGSIGAAREAMRTTFLHWGLHAWSIYIVVGLSLAYFAYRHDLPLTIRSTLYPLLGERIYGPIGHTVEIMAVFGTLFGVATSLGLGVMQINAGLDFLGVMEIATANQLWLIAGITLAATASVVSGLDRGIRRLSELNLLLGLIFVLFVFFAGPTFFLLNSFVQSIGQYAQNLIGMTFRTDAFLDPDWQKSWTMFYWGWWISWSPFVGMFIARISRGRTIRQFIAGVLLAPSLLTFFWMVVFGNTAIHMELFGGGGIVAAVSESVPTALFVLLGNLPWSTFSSILATFVVATYFITSSDSGSLVIDILTAEGDLNPPIAQRVFWALTEGAVAAVLLLTGGLVALQTAAITTAAPLCVIMVFMCFSLVKGLRSEPVRIAKLARREELALGIVEEQMAGFGEEEMVDWRRRLRVVVSGKKPVPPKKEVTPTDEARRHLREFIAETALPAFEELRKELAKHGRGADIEREKRRATLTVYHDDEEEFSYTICTHVYNKMSSAFPEIGTDFPPVCLAEVIVRNATQKEEALDKFTRETIIADFLAEYEKWRGW